MASAAEQVDAVFSDARGFADAAESNLSGYLGALNEIDYAPIQYDIKWEIPESIPDAPERPERPPRIGASEFEFKPPKGGVPQTLIEEIPKTQLNTSIPELRVFDIPDIAQPDYPLEVPIIPEVGTVQIPDAPQVDFGVMPAMMQLNTIAAPSINLREDWLSRLERVPTLEIVQPTPYSYALGEEYASQLLDGLKATLNARLAGGTGLPKAIEQAIWDRARGREAAAARGAESEVMRNSEALGYALPAGVTAHQLREAQQATATRMAELSRDIAIKQSDLEQSNIRDAISAGMQLEKQLIDYCSQREQLVFDAARAAADTGIQEYNGRLQHLQVLLQGYQAYAAGYKTIIDAELAKVEVFKARLEGERSKADVNKALVEQFKASVEAGMARVEVYRAQVGGAQAQIEFEKAKIAAAGERVRGYVAQVNAEVSKLEGQKTRISAISVMQSAETARISAFGARAQAEGDVARTLLARYEALARAKAAEWEGYKSQVLAETARINALGSQAAASVEEYKVDGNMYVAQANVEMSRWEKSLTAYKQGLEHITRERELNVEKFKWGEEARRESAKVSAQVYAQLTASAYGMLNANASISGSYNFNTQVPI